jgi:hypothetical protein
MEGLMRLRKKFEHTTAWRTGKMAQYEEPYYEWLTENEKSLLTALEQQYPSFIEQIKIADVCFKKMLIACANNAPDKDELEEQWRIFEKEYKKECKLMNKFVRSFGIKQPYSALDNIRRCL